MRGSWIVLVVVGVAALAWWALGTRAPRPAVHLEDAAHATPRVGPETAAATPEREGREASRATVAGVPSSAMATIRVLEADGTPAAGATVAFQLSRERPDDLPEGDPAELAARFGRSGTTDTDGVARIPCPPFVRDRDRNRVHVYAFTPEAYAVGAVLYHELLGEGVELRLTTEQVLEIRVLDSWQRPAADVDVAVLGTTGWRLGATDADGRLVARHVQSWFAGRDAAARPTTVTIAPVYPGSTDELGIEVSIVPPPRDEVRLWLPPTGTVVVRDSAQANLEPDRATDIRLETLDDDERVRTRPPGHATPQAGEARFPRVALGRRFVARRADRHEPRLTFDGPTAPGEERIVTFPMSAAPFLVGRLLRDGGPLVDTEFTLDARRGDDDTSGGRTRVAARTGDDGHFRVARSETLSGSRWTGFRATVHDGEPGPGQQRWVARFAGDRTLLGGDNDLGDGVLVEEPPLVGGRVVGLPEGAKPDDLFLTVVGPNGRVGPGDDVDLRVAADGAFVGWGTTEFVSPFLLPVSDRILPTAPTPFTPSQRDVELRVSTGGSIEADIVCPDPRVGLGLRAWLVPTDGRPADALRLTNPFGPDEPDFGIFDRRAPRGGLEYVRDEPPTQRLRWPAVPAGRYRLEFGGHARPPLRAEQDVVVGEGEVTRVGPVDLGTDLKFVAISLGFPPGWGPATADPSGPLAGPLGHLLLGHPDASRAESFAIDGVLAWFVTERPTAVTIEIPGLRRVELVDVFEDREVQLRPGIPVTITAASDDGRDDSIRVRLEPAEGARIDAGERVYSPAEGGMTSRRPTWPWTSTDGAQLETRVTAPGRWDVDAERREDGAWHAVEVAPAFVDVPESGVTVELVLGPRHGR